MRQNRSGPLHSRAFIAAALAISLVAACDPVPDASDDQLMKLVGESSMFGSDDKRLAISRSRLECVRLLADLDKAIYKEMPTEILGRIKTDCRKNLDTVLKDTARNPMGFKLEHFENKNLAERISQLKAKTDEQAKLAAAAERTRLEAAARAKSEERLKKAREQIATVVASLDAQLGDADSLCNAHKTLKTRIQQQNIRSAYRYKILPSLCRSNALDDVRSQVTKVANEIAKASVTGSGTFYTVNIPYFGAADPEWLAKELTAVRNEVDAMKAEVGSLQ